MNRITDGSAARFLADLQRLQTVSERAQRQLSSGLKVERPSDAPEHIDDILQLGAEANRITQVQANLGRAKLDVDSAEGALQSALKIVERAQVLAAQGSGDLRDAAGRDTIAHEVAALQEQLLGISNLVVGGRYIFGGDRDQSAPYRLDPGQPNGVERLSQAQATRGIQDAAGILFSVSRTAQDIFDHRDPADDSLAKDNVFAAIAQLRTALENDDAAAVAVAGSALGQAGEYLNRQLGWFGAAQNRVAEALEQASNFQLRTTTALSGERDADMTEAILELTKAQTSQQAALSARAQIPRTSLFDFLR